MGVFSCAAGGTRTHTGIFPQQILSLSRIPFRHRGKILRPGWDLHPCILLLQRSALATWLPGHICIFVFHSYIIFIEIRMSIYTISFSFFFQLFSLALSKSSSILAAVLVFFSTKNPILGVVFKFKISLSFCWKW